MNTLQECARAWMICWFRNGQLSTHDPVVIFMICLCQGNTEEAIEYFADHQVAASTCDLDDRVMTLLTLAAQNAGHGVSTYGADVPDGIISAVRGPILEAQEVLKRRRSDSHMTTNNRWVILDTCGRCLKPIFTEKESGNTYHVTTVQETCDEPLTATSVRDHIESLKMLLPDHRYDPQEAQLAWCVNCGRTIFRTATISLPQHLNDGGSTSNMYCQTPVDRAVWPDED